jgi:hypothetical protein
MATTYVRGLDGLTGKHVVLRVTEDPSHTVVAVVDTETRATQIASLLTEDEE